jgi:single-strand DNA-binding protein
MNSLNLLSLEGRLTADPLVKATEKGTLLCSFSIAHNRFFKIGDETKQEVSFFDVEAWDKTAELCRDLALKGTLVRITGRLRQNRWEDAEGNPHARIVITADRIEFQVKKIPEADDGGENGGFTAPDPETEAPNGGVS